MVNIPASWVARPGVTVLGRSHLRWCASSARLRRRDSVDLSSEQDRALYDAWLEWANRELKGSKARIEAAAAAAVDAALVTRDIDAAQQAARMAVITPAAARSAAVTAQVAHADYVAAELSRFQATYPGRSLTVADAIAWYRRRRIALDAPPEVPPASANTPTPAALPSANVPTS